MLYEEGPLWKTCIGNRDMPGLREIVSIPGFDLEQLVDVDFFDLESEIPYTRKMTPLGYALKMRNIDAFDILLAAGANPDAAYIIYPKAHPYGNHTCRVLEGSISMTVPRGFAEKLLQYGASTIFKRHVPGVPFMEEMHLYDLGRSSMIREARDRELRAYTAVWCALNAGGSWPDMAVLLQAMVMRDDLSCETSTPSSKRRKK